MDDVDAVRISVQENGPYQVHGWPPLRRVQVVESEHGEPLTTRTTDRPPLPEGDVFFLCRCGQSSNRPFCDGSHERGFWDGTETAPTSTYDERARTFEAQHLVVRDDRGICEHAGFCGNRLTNVWKLMKGDATDDSIVRAQVLQMVERCPSGALTYRFPDDETDVEPELPVAIGVVDDGPLFVTGRVAVERADGAPFESRHRMTLCRCGASSSKPLCDGTHAKVGFRDR